MRHGFRITRVEFVKVAMSGEGARQFGGRWNPPGSPAVYAAESPALAALEILVHIPPRSKLPRYRMIRVSFPESIVGTLDVRTLPPRWRGDDQLPKLQELGAKWLQQQRSAILAVPSVVIDGQTNYVLNPAHPDFKGIVVDRPRSFWLDPRLVK